MGMDTNYYYSRMRCSAKKLKKFPVFPSTGIRAERAYRIYCINTQSIRALVYYAYELVSNTQHSRSKDKTCPTSNGCMYLH